MMLRTNMAIEVKAHIAGTVWQIRVKPGDSVAEDDAVVVLETMKMEMPVEAPEDGVVGEICVEEGQAVQEGDVVAVLEPT